MGSGSVEWGCTCPGESGWTSTSPAQVQGGQVHEEDSAETLEGQGQTRIELSALASQKWDSDTLIIRQILMDEGPWRGTDMTVAWELYFQA